MAMYVTHVKVEHVSEEVAKGTTYRNGVPNDERKRVVVEVGSVTVKARTLADLARKISAHIELFDDRLDEVQTGGMDRESAMRAMGLTPR